ncbi:Methyl-accepting chemotaxis sensory transducer, partial [Candidatus Arthromitus sp. SFB-5]
MLNITNETKLLSLNASIVAISAGEHGKSFGVITKEIGELSQNIIKSTSYIQQTLVKISDTINSLNKESIEIFETFKVHSENSKIFISNLSEMYTSVKDITNFLKNISFFTDKISNKNNTLIDSITSLSSSSSYNLNSIKQIENLITKINDNALTFKNSFESLNNTISQIKSDLN